jgi:hypothetical protein
MLGARRENTVASISVRFLDNNNEFARTQNILYLYRYSFI